MSASANLGRNLRTLREARGLSQEQIARLAGIPRATWSHLESGAGNPTLAVLTRAAAALHVGLEELVGPPRPECRLYPAAEIPLERRGGATLRRLLPEPLPGLEADRIELPAGATLPGVPHTPGTREYLACEAGRIELAVAGEVHRLGPGDVLVFRGDQRHSYKNPGRGTAVAYSVVTLAGPLVPL